MSNNQDIDVLIALMGKLPGLGPRSARRAVLHLIKKRDILYHHYLMLYIMLLRLPESA